MGQKLKITYQLQLANKIRKEPTMNDRNKTIAVKKPKRTSSREKYIETLSKQLKKWDKELTELEEKGEKRVEKFKINLSEKIRNLKAKRDELRDKLIRLEEAGETAFQDIRKDIEKLWKDIQKGFDSTKKELKK